MKKTDTLRIYEVICR